MPAQTIWPNDNLLEIDFPMESVLLLLLFVARLIVKFCGFFLHGSAPEKDRNYAVCNYVAVWKRYQWEKKQHPHVVSRYCVYFRRLCVDVNHILVRRNF